MGMARPDLRRLDLKSLLRIMSYCGAVAFMVFVVGVLTEAYERLRMYEDLTRRVPLRLIMYCQRRRSGYSNL